MDLELHEAILEDIAKASTAAEMARASEVSGVVATRMVREVLAAEGAHSQARLMIRLLNERIDVNGEEAIGAYNIVLRMSPACRIFLAAVTEVCRSDTQQSGDLGEVRTALRQEFDRLDPELQPSDEDYGKQGVLNHILTNPKGMEEILRAAADVAGIYFSTGIMYNWPWLKLVRLYEIARLYQQAHPGTVQLV